MMNLYLWVNCPFNSFLLHQAGVVLLQARAVRSSSVRYHATSTRTA